MVMEKKAILSDSNRFGSVDDHGDRGGGGWGYDKKDEGSGGDGDGHPGGSGKVSGLTVLTASVFLIGELAGTGVMALPHAMEGIGFSGIIISLLFNGVSCYTGNLICQCWLIVQSRCPEYRGHVRHPYPTIGYVCFGNCGRTILSCIINCSILGTGVVVMIMAAENVHRLLTNLADVQAPFCLILIAIAAVIIPLTWFGTPKDFWAIAIGAALSTTVAVVLSLFIMVNDSRYHSLEDVKHSDIDALTFFQALSTILFATCGHFVFPTFQNDMNEPDKIGKSLVISYSTMAILYIPVSVMGYVVYGDRISSNMLLTLSSNPVTYVIIMLVTCHQLCGFVIVINPVLQHFEEVLGISKAFSWKRAVARSSIVLFLLFVAESVPKIGAIMSLVGGSANLIVMLIAPVVLYLKLCSIAGDWPKIHVPLHVKILCGEILLAGTIIGVISTYGSVLSLWGNSSFTLPCYLNMTAVEESLY